MDSFIKNYGIVSTVYCILRKPFILSKYQVETQDSEYGNKKYRNLLYTEKIALTLIGGVFFGQIAAPFHLFQDIRNFELRLRQMQHVVYKDDDFKKNNFIDLLFV